MSTPDVPGANPANNDKLSRGCWGEHEDGSLIYVKDIDENARVIFEMYDFKDPSHPVYYPHAMALKDFEKAFSYDPKKVGVDNLKWTWHDKTPFPWDKVMRIIDRPLPVLANVGDNFSASERMALSLKARISEVLTREHIEEEQGLREGPISRPAATIRSRLGKAVSALLHG